MNAWIPSSRTASAEGWITAPVWACLPLSLSASPALSRAAVAHPLFFLPYPLSPLITTHHDREAEEEKAGGRVLGSKGRAGMPWPGRLRATFCEAALNLCPAAAGPARPTPPGLITVLVCWLILLLPHTLLTPSRRFALRSLSAARRGVSEESVIGLILPARADDTVHSDRNISTRRSSLLRDLGLVLVQHNSSVACAHHCTFADAHITI